MDPYLPVYHRSPNKFLRYDERRFDDGAGHAGTVRIALYQDKNGKQREETAQVIWDNGCPFSQARNKSQIQG